MDSGRFAGTSGEEESMSIGDPFSLYAGRIPFAPAYNDAMVNYFGNVPYSSHSQALPRLATTMEYIEALRKARPLFYSQYATALDPPIPGAINPSYSNLVEGSTHRVMTKKSKYRKAYKEMKRLARLRGDVPPLPADGGDRPLYETLEDNPDIDPKQMKKLMNKSEKRALKGYLEKRTGTPYQALKAAEKFLDPVAWKRTKWAMASDLFKSKKGQRLFYHLRRRRLTTPEELNVKPIKTKTGPNPAISISTAKPPQATTFHDPHLITRHTPTAEEQIRQLLTASLLSAQKGSTPAPSAQSQEVRPTLVPARLALAAASTHPSPRVTAEEVPSPSPSPTPFEYASEKEGTYAEPVAEGEPEKNVEHMVTGESGKVPTTSQHPSNPTSEMSAHTVETSTTTSTHKPSSSKPSRTPPPPSTRHSVTVTPSEIDTSQLPASRSREGKKLSQGIVDGIRDVNTAYEKLPEPSTAERQLVGLVGNFSKRYAGTYSEDFLKDLRSTLSKTEVLLLTKSQRNPREYSQELEELTEQARSQLNEIRRNKGKRATSGQGLEKENFGSESSEEDEY